MGILGLNDGFQFALLLGQGVEVGIRLSIGRIDFIQTLEGVFGFADGFFYGFPYCLVGIKLGLLGQVTYLESRHGTGFTFNFCVQTCHDFQQGGFTRAVETQDTNFGAGEETQ